MVWTAFQKYSKMIIQFISGIILARLLTPFDYGCIGMLSIFMVLAENFIDAGFGSALIQKKKAYSRGLFYSFLVEFRGSFCNVFSFVFLRTCYFAIL